MIPLYTYVSAFQEGKLRPGFRVEGHLFVLTSTRPRINYMALTESCCSGHFTSHGKKYVTLASNQEAYRYNNVVGGLLTLDVKKFEARFKVNLSDYLTNQHTDMSKLNAFATLHGFFILNDPSLLGFEGDAAKVAMGLVDTATGLPMEQSIGEAKKWLAAAETSEPAKKWGTKFQVAAIPLARVELIMELTTLYGAEAANGYNELIDDASIPEMVALTTAYLNSPEDAAALELITKTFGDPTAAATAPAEGVEINPEALEQALAENQAPVAEGIPAEELAGPEVLFEEEPVEGELTVQVNTDVVPTNPAQKAIVDLVKAGQEGYKREVKSALELRKFADNKLEEALAAGDKYNEEAVSLIEKIVGGASVPSETALIAETV